MELVFSKVKSIPVACPGGGRPLRSPGPSRSSHRCSIGNQLLREIYGASRKLGKPWPRFQRSTLNIRRPPAPPAAAAVPLRTCSAWQFEHRGIHRISSLRESHGPGVLPPNYPSTGNRRSQIGHGRELMRAIARTCSQNATGEGGGWTPGFRGVFRGLLGGFHPVITPLTPHYRRVFDHNAARVHAREIDPSPAVGVSWAIQYFCRN